MPVTDIDPTTGLPWWARPGGGQPTPAQQGSMPPGAAGMGWLQYLQSMFGQGGGNPANMPSQYAGPMANVTDLSGQGNTVAGFNAPPADPNQATPDAPHGYGPAAPPPAVVNSSQGPSPAQTVTRPALPDALPTGGYQPSPAAPQPAFQPPQRPLSGPPGSLNPQILAAGWNMPTPGGGGGGAAMQQAPFVNPNAPAPAAQPVSSAKGPLAAPTGGASGVGATSNPRFVQIDRPNMPASGGWRGGPPQMTALNLAGLFGGGQQAAANPANVPAANASPVSAIRRTPGPLAKGVTTNAPWNYGPMQRGMGWPSSSPYGPDYRDLAAFHSSYQ